MNKGLLNWTELNGLGWTAGLTPRLLGKALYLSAQKQTGGSRRGKPLCRRWLILGTQINKIHVRKGQRPLKRCNFCVRREGNRAHERLLSTTVSRSEWTLAGCDKSVRCTVNNARRLDLDWRDLIRFRSARPDMTFLGTAVVLALSSRARILGECSTIYSLPVWVFFFFSLAFFF